MLGSPNCKQFQIQDVKFQIGQNSLQVQYCKPFKHKAGFKTPFAYEI